MPFKSDDQRKWMWANDPEMARKWEKETPKGKKLPKKVKKAQEGATIKYVDSTLNVNKNLDFVKRLYEKDTPNIQVPGQPHPSTHLMAYDPNSRRVYPEVVNKQGKLVHLQGDDAWNYADSTKEFIEFPTADAAKKFSTSYKKGTGVLKENGGLMAKDGIHIKPENKGKFTAYKKRTGKTTEEALHSKDARVRKMANFAKNAKKWKHEDGGTISELGYKEDSPYKNRSKLNINTPSGVITTEDMAFPILANGVPLYPNTGDYQFNTKQVTEVPMKKKVRKAQSGFDSYLEDMWGKRSTLPTPVNPNAVQPQANPNYNANAAPVANVKPTSIDTSNLKNPLSTAKEKKQGGPKGYSGPSFDLGPLMQGAIGLTRQLLGPEQPVPDGYGL